MNPDIRQARSLRGPLKVVAAVTTASCLVAACTVTPLRIPPHHRVLPTGRILGVLAGPRFGVIEYAFSSRRSRGILLPEAPVGVFFVGRSPEFVAVTQSGGESRLLEVAESGQTRPISSPLAVPLRPAGGPVADLLAVESCQGRQPIFVMSLPASNGSARPKEVARGCPAALSPEGSLVAFSPDLASVWTAPVSGQGSPRPLVRLAGRKLLQSLGMRAPRIVAAAGMSWSQAGLAVAAEGEGRFACVVVDPTGRIRVIPLGAARPTALSWSPNGKLLAFTEHDRTGDAVRTFDASSHRLRLAALALGKQLQGIVWSPSGDAIVTLAGADRWLVVTPDGARVRSIVVPPGSIPFDWAS